MSKAKGSYCAVKLLLALLVGAMSAIPAQARFTPVECKNSYTPEQELALGQKAAAQVYSQMPILPDSSPITQYVQKLGQRLAEHAPGYPWPYNFHVVDSADINAFAIPGGSIFLNLGTIQAADTEAQLAGVMAHEISHVVQRHSTCNITKQRSKDFEYGLAGLASAILLGNTAFGGLAQSGIGMLQGLDYLRMSRDDEKQADLLGADILYDTGYDPRALPQFFEIIESKYGKGGAQFLSDHPNPGNRVDYVDAEIATLPRKTHYLPTSAEFKQIHAQAAAMHALTADEQKSGAWKTSGRYAAGPGNVGQYAGGTSTGAATGAARPVGALSSSVYLPQGNWKVLNQPKFTISFPGNWTAYEGASSVVTIAPSGGVATGQNGALAYGVVIDGVAGRQGGNASDAAVLAQTTQKLIANMQQQNGLTLADSAVDIRVNGLIGKSQDFEGVSPVMMNGRALREHDWVVTILRPDGDVNYLVFVAPERDYLNLKPVFEDMLRNFKAL